MSLDRLIRLAQRTGDRLIVHDRGGEDVVIMSVDEYEYMLDEMVGGVQDDDGLRADNDPDWHSANDVIEDRYHDVMVHDHRDVGRHDRQYHDDDWEEAVHPHEALSHQHVSSASTIQAQHTDSDQQVPPPPHPVHYHEHEGVEVDQHREEQLDEPVFYEEPV